jgi:hypothetical protein
MVGMEDIIARIDAHLAQCRDAHCQELEPDAEPILRDCRDEIIAARACAEMMLQGTGQRLAERMAERVINGQTIGAWILVSERLPEHGDAIWVYGKDVLMGEYWQGTGFHSYGASMDREGLNSETLHGVTHWMDIDEPEPPTE